MAARCQEGLYKSKFCLYIQFICIVIYRSRRYSGEMCNIFFNIISTVTLSGDYMLGARRESIIKSTLFSQRQSVMSKTPTLYKYITVVNQLNHCLILCKTSFTFITTYFVSNSNNTNKIRIPLRSLIEFLLFIQCSSISFGGISIALYF